MSSRYVIMATPTEAGFCVKPIRLSKVERRDDRIKTISRIAIYGEWRTLYDGISSTMKMIDVTSIITGQRKQNLEIYCTPTDTFPTRYSLSRKRLIILRKDTKWFRRQEVDFIISVLRGDRTIYSFRNSIVSS